MREPELIAVVGAGVMGAQIAQVLVTAGYRVLLHDARADALQAALARIEHHRFGLRQGVERGKLSVEQAEAALARITTVQTLTEACAGADVVVEAVYEDIGLKVRLFRQFDRLAPPHALLTSNSAGLPIAALAHATDRPEQVMGWHWFQPCAVMRLVELVCHPTTTPATRDAVIRISERCGKRPIVVNDQPLVWGFVANRINAAVRREAEAVVAEGVATQEQVDTIMREAFRWPMGPFELMQQASLD